MQSKHYCLIISLLKWLQKITQCVIIQRKSICLCTHKINFWEHCKFTKCFDIITEMSICFPIRHLMRGHICQMVLPRMNKLQLLTMMIARLRRKITHLRAWWNLVDSPDIIVGKMHWHEYCTGRCHIGWGGAGVMIYYRVPQGVGLVFTESLNIQLRQDCCV